MICTFFGHRDVSEKIEPILQSTLINLIEKKNVSLFYVGDKGNFDAMVKSQLEKLSEIYPIEYYIVLSCLPKKKYYYEKEEKNTILPEGIELVPPKFAISWRNKWMLKQSDFVVTYVSRVSAGSWKFKELAEKQRKIVIELSDKYLE